MQIIDTHTHLYLSEFNQDRDEVVRRAVENNVVKLLMPNIDIYSVDPMLAAESRYKGICYSMIGLHPTSVREDYSDQLDTLEKILHENRFIGIGEIGIDLYRDRTFIKEQIIAFRRQIDLAVSRDLPVAIHSREASEEILAVLDDFKDKNIRGVFHAFSGDAEIARKAIAKGFFLGIGGVVTFRNSGLDDVLKEIGPGHLVLETDSPYLAPVPFRGKRNESSRLPYVVSKLAEIFNTDPEKIAEITYRNSIELFHISGDE
jgi:TatD DNase family protein